MKCEEAQRIAMLHTIGLASLTNLKGDAAKSIKIYEEALELADSNSSPTEVVGPAVLGGSVGFRSDQKTIHNGTAFLDWQIKPDGSGGIGDVWSSITFGSAKHVNCLKVRACRTLPSELQEVASSWTVLEPKDCVLQMSSVSAGGGFVDVHSFTLSSDDAHEYTQISGFRAKKSKAWRLVVKSWHYDGGEKVSSPPGPERCWYYAGLDMQLFEPEIADDSLQRLHILHNASLVLSGLACGDDGEAEAKRLKMERERQSIQNNYMAHAEAIHDQSKQQLLLVTKEREKLEKELKDLSDDSHPWYEDLLAWLAIYCRDEEGRHNFCEAIRYALQNYYESVSVQSGLSEDKHIYVLIRRGKFPTFSSVDGLHVALAMRIKQGEDEVGLSNLTQKKCVQRVMGLTSMPTDGEVYTNAHCGRCREDWKQTGPTCCKCCN